ncbi:MAG TPA: PAS domain S-box protein [Flavobacterium sp.]|jgi:PAS domain S-box-containing protein
MNTASYRKRLDSLLEGIQILNHEFRYVYLNDIMAEQAKAPKESLLGHTMMEKFPGIENTEMFTLLGKCMKDRQPRRMENHFAYPDGTSRWFDLVIEPAEEGVCVLSLDITQQKLSLERLTTTRNLYAFLSQINQNIVHVKDAPALFSNSCHIALARGMFSMAWIQLFSHDGMTVSLAAQAGLPDEVLPLLVEIESRPGSPHDTVFTNGQYHICTDFSTCFKQEGMMALAAAKDIRECILLPIKKSGAVVGTFTLCSSNPLIFDKNVIDMLTEVAGDISFALDVFETERMRLEAEALVKANEKRFRALIEKSADMKTMATAEGRLVYGSPSVTKILGYDLPAMFNTFLFDIVHPDDIEDFKVQREKLLREPGGYFRFEMRIKHTKGHWVWCEGVATNLLHEPGVNALVSNFIDISEKKAAEQQREFDRNNLYALINNTSDLLWSVDTDFLLITSNKPFNDFIRSRYGKVLEKGSYVLELTPPEQQDWYLQHYRRAFAGEAFTESRLMKSPTPIWAELSFFPIRSGKQIIGTACQLRNVTGQKNLEQSLHMKIREISDYKHALDQSSIVAITDQKGIIRHVNDNFCSISKYSRSALIGQDHRIINSGHHSKEFFQDLWKTIAGGQIWKGEIKNRAKDGTFYWVDTTIVPFLDEKRKPYQYIAIRFDITQRKEAEEKLLSGNAELKKANLELDRFVYSISHDLRAPLTSILGLLLLLEEETREEETRNYAQLIHSSVNRLDNFIRNILSYSRNNRIGMQVERIPLQDTINGTIAALRGTTGREGIDFTVTIDERDAFHSDRQSFVTILENLISNAIKFRTHDAGSFIRISGTSADGVLDLSIADNGIGIPPQHHAKIFDMFYRLSGAVEGSGIGLYIVKEIVEKLDGSISVESEEGKGTVFKISLKNLDHGNKTDKV